MLNNPLVSIVLPCYNHEQFIRGSIQGVIDQDYENIELIIIDDGSRDNSKNIIEEMIPVCQDRFVRFTFRSRPNKGVSATLNEGLCWARGQYISFCSSDDIFRFDKVRLQVDYFHANSGSKFCFSKAFVIDDNNNLLARETDVINSSLRSDINVEDILTFKVHFPVTGMYCLDFLLRTLGGFDEQLSAEDYDINLRVVSNTKVGFIDECLYYYRSPAAIGGNRKRFSMRVDVSESHRKSIEKYANHPAYKKALGEWNFRRFIFFSPYSQTKLYSFRGMLLSLNKLNRLDFFKALFKLILVWR